MDSKIYEQSITFKPQQNGRYTTNAQVMQAVEDRMNGNRPLTSKAVLKLRIGEVRRERYDEHVAFEAWRRKILQVRG